MSNFREMTPNGSGMGVGKKFKLLKYEHNIYQFKARDLRLRKYKFFREIFKFCKNTRQANFAKFLKVFIKLRNLNISRK